MECWVHPLSCQLRQELQCYCQGGCMRLDDFVRPNELGQEVLGPALGQFQVFRRQVDPVARCECIACSSMAIRVVHLHHTSRNDGIMCSCHVPQRLFCKLAYTDKFRIGVETLSQLWDVPVVEFEGCIARARAHTTVERELNHWAVLCPIVLAVAD